MKQTLTLLLLITICTVAQESSQIQQPGTPKTELEKFFSKSGELIIKEFGMSHELSGSSTTKIAFQIINVYSPGRESSGIKGIRVTVSSPKKESSSFLDIDELESLKSALEYIWREREKLISMQNYIEVIFKTKDEFKFGAYVRDKELRLFASIDKYPYPNFFADFNDYNELSATISQLIQSLNNKQ